VERVFKKAQSMRTVFHFEGQELELRPCDEDIDACRFCGKGLYAEEIEANGDCCDDCRQREGL